VNGAVPKSGDGKKLYDNLKETKIMIWRKGAVSYIIEKKG